MWMLCPCYVLVPVQFTPCPEIFGTRFPENREELDTLQGFKMGRLHCGCCLRSDCLVVLWYAKQGLHQTCDVLNAPSGFRFSPALGFPCPLFFGGGKYLPTQPPPEPHHDEEDDDDDRPLEPWHYGIMENAVPADDFGADELK